MSIGNVICLCVGILVGSFVTVAVYGLMAMNYEDDDLEPPIDFDDDVRYDE